jgi:hypothetical protein
MDLVTCSSFSKQFQFKTTKTQVPGFGIDLWEIRKKDVMTASRFRGIVNAEFRLLLENGDSM